MSNSVPVSDASSRPVERDPRRHDLDALRAAAMLLGIVYHAALSLAAGFPWFIQDPSANRSLYVFQSWVHGFRMPLFFIVSGFFTAMLWRKRGALALLSHRFRRVLLPCLVGAVTVVPLCSIAIAVAMSSGAARRAAAVKSQAPEESIWAAIRQSRADVVAQHLEQGVSCSDLHPEFKTTPLSWATILGELSSVRLLLEKGCDPSQPNPDGNTPLHSAMFFGHYEISQVLLDHQADPKLRNNNGETPLDSLRVDVNVVPFIAGFLSMQVDLSQVQNGRKLIEADAKHRQLELPPEKKSVGAATKVALANGSPSANSSSQLTQRLTRFWEWLSTAPLFSYLWFLWFLWWFVVGFVILQGLFKGIWKLIAGGRPINWSWVVNPASVALLIGLTILPNSKMTGGEMIFGPDTSVGLLLPGHLLVYYGLFFLYGVGYYLSQSHGDKLGRTWRWSLPLSMFVLFPIVFEISTGTFGLRDQWVDPSQFRSLAIVGQSMFAWTMSIACIGAFRSMLTTEKPWVRYLSDSSYWLYVTHLPLVVVLQNVAAPWTTSAWIKLLFVSGVTIAVLLLLYQAIVRKTWIGVFLNGPRTSSSSKAT
jgi:surface polysaccharide O-acyltransferase-like enzyme